MGKWLERLKDVDARATDAREPRQPYQVDEDAGFLGFQACPPAPFQRSDIGERVKAAAANNGSAIDPDRWCWPHSAALTSAEIEVFFSRLAQFTDKGMSYVDAERLADSLVNRDREGDDRRMCLECSALSSNGRCLVAARSGLSGADRRLEPVINVLQRCEGFRVVGFQKLKYIESTK